MVAAGHALTVIIPRSYTGVGATKSTDTALELCGRLSESKYSRSTRARGVAIIAHIYYEERGQQKPGSVNIDAVYRGAIFANKAAALGFVPPIVLSIADMVERVGFRRVETCPPGHSVDRFVALEDLWRAYERRKEQVEMQEQNRQMKVQQNRNLYFCAASGCGIEGTHKSGLSRCSGECPLEGKPSYCGKECQRRVSKPFARQAFCALNITDR